LVARRLGRLKRIRCDTVKEGEPFGDQMISEIRCLRMKYAG